MVQSANVFWAAFSCSWNFGRAASYCSRSIRYFSCALASFSSFGLFGFCRDGICGEVATSTVKRPHASSSCLRIGVVAFQAWLFWPSMMTTRTLAPFSPAVATAGNRVTVRTAPSVKRSLRMGAPFGGDKRSSRDPEQTRGAHPALGCASRLNRSDGGSDGDRLLDHFLEALEAEGLDDGA